MLDSAVVASRAMMAAGVLTLIANAVFTPLMLQLPAEAIAASDVFLIRLSVAAAGVLLLILGLVGLHPRHAVRGRFAGLAYWLAMIGTALLFAHEWAQVFFVHPLAGIDPEALRAMEYGEGPSWVKIEGIAVLSVFTLGWLALTISMLVAGAMPRRGPLLLLVGIFAVPFLAAGAHALVGEANAYWGAVAGNVILSSGWIVLGWDMMKRPV